MVHRLHLLRHAKSSWEHGGIGDHERPLAPRGWRACAALTDHLHGTDVAPNLVLCSSARRTRETLDGIRAALPDHLEVEVDEALYGAATSTLLGRLRDLPDTVAEVLLIGHNPAIGELAAGLAGDGDDDARSRLRQGYPTGALASFRHEGTWHELAPGRGTMTDFVVPRELA